MKRIKYIVNVYALIELMMWESIIVHLRTASRQIFLFNICPFFGTAYKSHHHHHHVMPLARIFLTLSRHFSLSFIVSGKSSGLYPVSSQSCCMYVRSGRPTFARPYVGVHRSTSLIVHRLWQVFRAISRILTELLYVCSIWSSYFCSAICGGP